MMIRVTEDHIKNGVRKECWKCPVALAIAEGVIGSSNAAVGAYRIHFDIGYQRWSFETPVDVRDFVLGFDFGDPVEPFEFELDLTPGS